MTATDPKPQHDKFKDLAREPEVDEDEAAFKAKLRNIATAPGQRQQNPKPSE
ncbi:MAG: hypothetical protein ABI398_14770 [Devosia sp.]